jgi:hypothetical protein
MITQRRALTSLALSVLFATALISSGCSDDKNPVGQQQNPAGGDGDKGGDGDGTSQGDGDKGGDGDHAQPGDGDSSTPGDGDKGGDGDSSTPGDGDQGGDGDAMSGDGDSAGDGDHGGDGFGVHTCLPTMKDACKAAIDLTVADPNGKGKAFTDAVPDATAAMQEAACIACSMLYHTPDEVPQQLRHTRVKLVIEGNVGVAYTITEASEMHVDHDYVSDFASNNSHADTVQEMMGVLLHETVHLYQNYGEFHTGEGMADWVRVRVGRYKPGRCGRGGTWMDGYTTTGCFFSWLTGPSVYNTWHHPHNDLDLGYKINKVLGEQGASGVPELFKQTFGDDVDTLWNQYQADIQ